MHWFAMPSSNFFLSGDEEIALLVGAYKGLYLGLYENIYKRR